MISDGRTTTYFCIDPSDGWITRLQDVLERHPHLSRRLFLLDALGFDVALKKWLEIINARRRTLVRLVSHKCIAPGAGRKFLRRYIGGW
jgi:hypothetical protein